MPTRRDLERLIRARMQKTGEAYTTARAQVLKKSTPPAARFAELAGMSEDAVRAKTGRTWKEWVRALDAFDAVSLSHREIAKRVHEEHDVSGWWAQTVTVGYERIRGLREIGQRRSGAFDANKSKTFPAPVERLYRAFSVRRTRERWLPGVDLAIRTSTTNKSMRITWEDDTSVHAYFTSKGPEKSQVAIQHVGLASGKEAAARKDYWAERLADLAELLGG